MAESPCKSCPWALPVPDSACHLTCLHPVACDSGRFAAALTLGLVGYGRARVGWQGWPSDYDPGAIVSCRGPVTATEGAAA